MPEVWTIERSTMAHREAFDQRLMELMKRSPKYHEEWLTITSGQRSLTPTGIRAVLWSMDEDGVISRAELTEMLDQLDNEVLPPLPCYRSSSVPSHPFTSVEQIRG
jgi:hypothetical protein